MFTAILVALGNALKATGDFFHWAAGRDDLNNSAEMKAGATAGQIAAARDSGARAIAAADAGKPEDLEKGISP